MEFLILLNRIVLDDPFCYTEAITSNPAVQKIIKYINDHISEDALSDDEMLLIDLFRQIPFESRPLVLSMIKAALKNL